MGIKNRRFVFTPACEVFLASILGTAVIAGDPCLFVNLILADGQEAAAGGAAGYDRLATFMLFQRFVDDRQFWKMIQNLFRNSH